MSLLEDVFLQDEADEAQELERVIEGGDYEERVASNSDDNSEKEDEAEEDKRRVDPGSTKTKRVVKNARFILNPARLTGPRGIQVIPEHFKDFKFKGKGQEKDDLDLVLKKLEHWAYRLYPKFKFEDCLKKIEILGKKRPVMVHLQKIRSDQFISDELVVQKDSSEDEAAEPEPDEFDKLLQQQIDLARATPAPANRSIDTSFESRSMAMPKATSSPSISLEQRERMLQNRKLAEARRNAKINNCTYNTSNSDNSNVYVINNTIEDKRKDVDIPHEKNEGDTDGQNQTSKERASNENFAKNISLQNPIDSSGAISDKNINETTQRKKRKANIINSSDDEIEINDISSKLCMATTESNEIKKTYVSNQNVNNELNKNSGLDAVLENSIIQSTIQGLLENDNNINLERDINSNGINNPENDNEAYEELMDVELSKDILK